ncbi:MAG: hypothetical protein JSV56_08420 [Methanomassiliicoccales archaeon]|nr:MAG: hypothetical protein JSV56_08420 [Methanomassiliicoccales archaeon]
MGADIGGTTFFSDYLHANFVSDDSGESQIRGVSGDPISGPFSSSNIPIVSSSPSRISPGVDASTIFTYQPSSNTAGIKAVHDLDSRVVYFPFLYFLGTDSVSNKMTLMQRVLDWVIVKIDYITLRDSPGDSGNVISDIYLKVGDSLTVWAASYNNDLGFLGNYALTFWKEDSMGSVITITSPGGSTQVQSTMTGGLVTLTVLCFFAQNTSDIMVVDHIHLTNFPDGPPLTSVTMGAAEEIAI